MCTHHRPFLPINSLLPTKPSSSQICGTSKKQGDYSASLEPAHKLHVLSRGHLKPKASNRKEERLWCSPKCVPHTGFGPSPASEELRTDGAGCKSTGPTPFSTLPARTGESKHVVDVSRGQGAHLRPRPRHLTYSWTTKMLTLRRSEVTFSAEPRSSAT